MRLRCGDVSLILLILRNNLSLEWLVLGFHGQQEKLLSHPTEYLIEAGGRLDNIGEDLIIKDLPSGSIEIKNPSTGQAITLEDKRLLGPLDILIRENKIAGFKGSIYAEGFKISRETEDSLRISLEDSFVIVKDADIVKVYIAIVNCVEDYDTYQSIRTLMAS